MKPETLKKANDLQKLIDMLTDHIRNVNEVSTKKNEIYIYSASGNMRAEFFDDILNKPAIIKAYVRNCSKKLKELQHEFDTLK